MKHRPQYKDKHTISQQERHNSNMDDDRNMSHRQRKRKRKRNFDTFRISLPESYKFWWDSLDSKDQDLVYTFKQDGLESLRREYPGNLLKRRDLTLDKILN